MNMSFIDRKVSVNRAIAILAKNDIEIGDEEAAVILDFLYLISKNHNKLKEEKST
jgi:hypothetical protein